MSALQQAARVYRAMTRSDLPAAHGLSAQLNWPHRLEDWGLLHRLFKGFVVCDGERLIGTAFACPQGAFATIGLVVVSPDYQGQGIGRQLMELALEACNPATAILNASAAGAPLYLSQGFIEFGTIEQRQGPARSVALEPLAAASTHRIRFGNWHWPTLAAGWTAVQFSRSCMARSNTRQVSSATRSYRLLPCCAAPGVVIALVR